MGMFFNILSSINDPNQQGNITQLESLINTIQKAGADRGIPASQLQNVMSILGDFVRPAMQQQSNSSGGLPLKNLLNQATGSTAAADAFQSLISPQLQQQIAQGMSQRTGMSPNTLQGMLSTLMPSILGLLNMGEDKTEPSRSNAILNAFLDGEKDDLGNVFQFATRFLNPPQTLNS